MMTVTSSSIVGFFRCAGYDKNIRQVRGGGGGGKKINSGLVDENAYRHALDKYTPERLGGMVRDFINSQMNNR